MHIDGQCHCGAIAFEGEIDPDKVLICHCTDCQASTGAAYRVNVPVAGDKLTMLRGTPATYVKQTAESGNPRAQMFCRDCGSPLYSTSPGDGPKASYMLRVGILKQRGELSPKVQNWSRSKFVWTDHLADLPRNEKAAG